MVGPPRPVNLERAVIFVQEAEIGGGPVPAVGAALGATGGASVVVVLAVDLPLLTSADLARLLSALAGEPGARAAAAVDHRGRPHPLLAAYRAEALIAAIAALEGTGRGVAASSLLPGRVSLVDLGPIATLNVNTPDDLVRARSALPTTAPGGSDSP